MSMDVKAKRPRTSRQRLPDDLNSQKAIYARWAPVYDQVYSKLLQDAHKRTASAVSEGAETILEIGVGTGLMLPYYPRDRHVVGVDLSSPMLKKAAQRVAKRRLDHVRGLAGHGCLPSGFRRWKLRCRRNTLRADPRA